MSLDLAPIEVVVLIESRRAHWALSTSSPLHLLNSYTIVQEASNWIRMRRDGVTRKFQPMAGKWWAVLALRWWTLTAQLTSPTSWEQVGRFGLALNSPFAAKPCQVAKCFISQCSAVKCRRKIPVYMLIRNSRLGVVWLEQGLLQERTPSPPLAYSFTIVLQKRAAARFFPTPGCPQKPHLLERVLPVLSKLTGKMYTFNLCWRHLHCCTAWLPLYRHPIIAIRCCDTKPCYGYCCTMLSLLLYNVMITAAQCYNLCSTVLWFSCTVLY